MEYVKAVYCHPAYLTYMQGTSWEMLGWKKHKLESRFPGEISIISDISKVMFKILQARLQQYMSCELPDVQAGFRKGRGTRDQIANIRWIIKKAREFQKNIYFCFIDYAKAFDCVDHKKLWKILKEIEYRTIRPASWEICMQVRK